MIYELREYRMKMSRSSAFLQNFGDKLVPVMKECGFDIVGTWTTYFGTGANTDLVWILRWDDLAARERGFKTMRAHPGFAEYSASNADNIDAVTSRFIKPTSFSPLQ